MKRVRCIVCRTLSPCNCTLKKRLQIAKKHSITLRSNVADYDELYSISSEKLQCVPGEAIGLRRRLGVIMTVIDIEDGVKEITIVWSNGQQTSVLAGP